MRDSCTGADTSCKQVSVKWKWDNSGSKILLWEPKKI